MSHTEGPNGSHLGYEKDENNFGRNREAKVLADPEEATPAGSPGRHPHPDNTDDIPEEEINID